MTQSILDEVWQEGLKEQLDKLPDTEHLDDGGYNDGQIAGFELGAQWGYNKCKEMLSKKMRAVIEFDLSDLAESIASQKTIKGKMSFILSLKELVE